MITAVYDRMVAYFRSNGPECLDKIDRMVAKAIERCPELDERHAFQLIRVAYNEANRDPEVDA